MLSVVRTRKFSGVTGMLLLALGLTGCSQSARDLPLDQEAARSACQTFLTSWKEGGTSKALEPGIIGVDEAWSSGKTLVGFEVIDGETNDGTNLHIPVLLTLKDASGKESKAKVTYCVGTSPRVTVFRD